MMNPQTWMKYLSMLLIPVIFTGAVLMITYSNPSIPVSLAPVNHKMTQLELVLAQAGGHVNMPATPFLYDQVISDPKVRALLLQLHRIPPIDRRISESIDLHQLHRQ
jgi:hypothetical protein